MVRLVLLLFFFFFTLPALAEEPVKRDVPTLAGTRSFQEYFRTECPEAEETECLKLWAAARIERKQAPVISGGIPIPARKPDGSGVPLVPQSSATPRRGTFEFVPPTNIDAEVERRRVQWEAERAKEAAKKVRDGK